jgi:hypothetical protein
MDADWKLHRVKQQEANASETVHPREIKLAQHHPKCTIQNAHLWQDFCALTLDTIRSKFRRASDSAKTRLHDLKMRCNIARENLRMTALAAALLLRLLHCL